MNYVDGIKIDLETIYGRRGDVLRAGIALTQPFPGEKLIASDDYKGSGTIIRQIFVDGYPIGPVATWWQRFTRWLSRNPLRRGMPTYCFSAEALGNGLSLRAQHSLAVEVEFLFDGKWRGSVLGRR